MPYSQHLKEEIRINAAPSAVWHLLTYVPSVKAWMSESPLEIITDWIPSHPFIIRGELHGIAFENKGAMLLFEPEKQLVYTHLSSLSGLADIPEHYTRLTFQLDGMSACTTLLRLDICNFPTESIYRHMAFYWRVALRLLQQKAEQR